MAIHSSRNEDARRKVSHTWHRQNATRKKTILVTPLAIVERRSVLLRIIEL